MFEAPKVVARWSIIGGLANTAGCARCFFIHEYALGAWLLLLTLGMVGQFYFASVDVEKLSVAWYRGDDLCCWVCGGYFENAGQLAACPRCGVTEKPDPEI